MYEAYIFAVLVDFVLYFRVMRCPIILYIFTPKVLDSLCVQILELANHNWIQQLPTLCSSCERATVNSKSVALCDALLCFQFVSPCAVTRMGEMLI